MNGTVTAGTPTQSQLASLPLGAAVETLGGQYAIAITTAYPGLQSGVEVVWTDVGYVPRCRHCRYYGKARGSHIKAVQACKAHQTTDRHRVQMLSSRGRAT